MSKYTTGELAKICDVSVRTVQYRELDIPINSIKDLLSEEHPEKVISVILSEQKQALKTELAEKQAQYDRLETLQQSLKEVENFSVESIGDIAHIIPDVYRHLTVTSGFYH